MDQSTGAAEYSDCISTEGQNSGNKCPVYDAKQSGDEASVMLGIWGMQSTPLFAIAPRSTLVRYGSTW